MPSWNWTIFQLSFAYYSKYLSIFEFHSRCAYFSTDLVYNVEEQEKLSSEDVHLIKFLHYYSKYLSIEKKKLDDLVDSTSTPDGKFSASLHSLCMELKEMNIQVFNLHQYRSGPRMMAKSKSFTKYFQPYFTRLF